MDDHATYTETEEKIFDAALVVFSRKGKDGARMQEIALEAGINKALLHYYFRSKDRLYEAVFKHVFQVFMSALSGPMSESASFPDMLRGFIDNFILTHAAHPEICRLWVHENLSGSPVVGPMLRSYVDENSGRAPTVFINRMQVAVQAGDIRPVDPFQTFVTIVGASVFFFLAYPTLSAINPALARDRDAAIEARKKHLFDLLYNGLRKTNDH